MQDGYPITISLYICGFVSFQMIEKWEQSGSMKVVVKAPDKDSL